MVVALVAALATAGCGSDAETPNGDDVATTDADNDATSADTDDDAGDTPIADTDAPASDCPAGTQPNDDAYCVPTTPGSLDTLDSCVALDEVDFEVGDDDALAAALGAAEAGDVIGLLPGTYAGGLEVGAGVTVLGSCPSEVTITGPDDGVAVTMNADTRLEGVRLEFAAIGVQATGVTDVRVARFVVADTKRGLDIKNATALVEVGEIRDTKGAGAVLLKPGIGVRIAADSAVVLSAVRVVGSSNPGVLAGSSLVSIVDGELLQNTGANIHVEGGSKSLVRGCAVDDAQPDAVGHRYGVSIVDESTATVRANTVHGNGRVGILVDHGTATIDDNEVTGGGLGIAIQFTAAGTSVTSNTLHDNAGGGLVALQAAGTISDNAITESKADAGGFYGDGIYVGDDSDVVVTSNSVVGSARAGILVAAATARVTSNTVESTKRFGLWVQAEGRLEARENEIVGATQYAIGAIRNSQLLAVENLIDGMAEDDLARDGLLVSSGSAAVVDSNFYPVRGGLMPVRAAILIDAPEVPATADFLGLPAGQAVSVAGNDVKAAEYGVVLQDVGDLVTLGENSLDGATEALPGDLGLTTLDETMTLHEPLLVAVGE